MPRYAQLADCKDPALKVTEDHLLNADTLVDGDLAEKGILATDVDPLHKGLRLLAVFYACQLAAIDAQKGENSPMVAKANAYGQQAKAQSDRISRRWLGIETVGQPSGLGSIKVGRS